MTTIKFRRDTSANWTSVNPIPAQGEPCYETDTGKLKIGNGSDNYVTLPYVSDGGAANLPIASTTTLGAIKVGNNLTITADGTLSATGGSSGDLPIATATTLGGIKVGNNLSITEDGTLSATGGSTGTTDYTQLENKPQINSVELTGNKTLNDLGIQPKGNYATTADIPTKTSELTNDSGFITSIPIASSTVSGTVKVGSNLSIKNGVLNADNQRTTVDSALSSTSTNPVQNKVINSALAGKQDTIDDLATIRQGASKGATSIQPNDNISKLTNDAGYLTEAPIPTNMVTTDTDQTISGSKTFSSDIVAKSAARLKLNNAGNNETIALSTSSTGYLNIRCTGTSLPEFISMYDNSNNLLDIAPTYIRTRTSGGTNYEYINSQNIDTTYMKWDSTGKLKVDTAAVAHLAMPSNTNVNLTLGANDTDYTAPADGYYNVAYTCSTDDSFVSLTCNKVENSQYTAAKGNYGGLSMPVEKESVLKLSYRNITTRSFKFIYAVGAVPTNT